MDFDFNLILVPITLFLGLIWLLDILWLKPQRRRKIQSLPNSKTEDIALVAPALEVKKQVYKDMLIKHNITYDTLESASVENAPLEVKQAERDYRDARRIANTANKKQYPQTTKPHFLIRWAHDYFPILAVVLIVRSFIIEPFNIPSSSMVPTLYTGDFVAVNKFAYGIRLPLTYNKVLDIGSPEHGDVVVFRYPENPKIYYIKRVIGLPGDSVSFKKGKLSVNGNVVPTQQVNFNADDSLTEQLYTPVKSNTADHEWNLSPTDAVRIAQMEESGAVYYQENLGEHTYLRRYLAPSLQQNQYSDFLKSQVAHGVSWQVKVPEGHYFVMGDNSDRSEDGRFWGFVPDQNLAGKAVYVWMHKKPGLLNLPTFAHNRNID